MNRFCVLSVYTVMLLFVLQPISYAQQDVPLFESSDCPIDVPDDPPIDYGCLVVPENHSKPESPTIRLPVIIIHSRSSNPAPDPLLYTEGGPGFSSLSSVWSFAKSSFVEDRDIIILEQRGNLYAEPSLECDISILWKEGKGNTPCLDNLKKRGIDLSNYTTESIVADIDALRRVLDYDEWNLYGSSYSTRLMLLTMHLHPEGIRSVILQSVNPPTDIRYKHDPEHAMRSLKVFFEDCAADPACAAAYPELETRFYALVRRLNDNPVPFNLVYPPTGERYADTVNGHRLLSWMVGDAFYGPARSPYKTAYLPFLIDQVERGNTDLLYPWLMEQWSQIAGSPFAWGLYFAVNCQDDAPAITTEDMIAQAEAYPKLDGYVRHRDELAICDAWDLPASRPLVTKPVESEIPTLILAGRYDPITPPEWSRAVAKNLTNSYYYEFASAGHNVGMDNPCRDSIMTAFLNDPTTAPNTTCIADVPGAEFVLPRDIVAVPCLCRITADIEMGGPAGRPLLEAILAACLLLFLVEITFLVIAGVVQLAGHRRREIPPDRIIQFAHPLAGLVSLLNIGLTIGIDIAVDRAFAPMYFGVPAELAPVFFIPLISAVLTAILIVIAFRAWIRHFWSIPKRVLFSLVILAAIAFASLLAYWDMITL